MALGRPAIPTPRTVDLRALQAAVDAARQRIEALERYLATASAAGTSASTAAATATTNASLAALSAEIATQISNLVALTLRVATVEASLADLSAQALSGQDAVLYDSAGQAILAGGRALLVV